VSKKNTIVGERVRKKRGEDKRGMKRVDVRRKKEM
tara:strand:- start:456 stop:560 length:105 start_codon:yes stop_codon:yes gene_type:complete